MTKIKAVTWRVPHEQHTRQSLLPTRRSRRSSQRRPKRKSGGYGRRRKAWHTDGEAYRSWRAPVAFLGAPLRWV
jgi:hypothetical protein